MKNKIVIFNVILLTLSLLVLFIFGISVNKTMHAEEAEKQIVDLTQIYASNYSDKITENVPDGIRVTIVDSSFKVIADSEDNSLVGSYHLGREEIESALEGNPKVVTRFSNSLNIDMAYYALKVDTAENGSYVFVRVAIPVENVNSYVQKTATNMLFVLLVALVVSFVASVVATNSIIKPFSDIRQSLELIKSGSFKPVTPSSSDKDINDIIAEINVVGEKLNESIVKENEDKAKLNYILSNISDGIIVLDERGNIEVINEVATNIFGIKNVVGKSYSVLSEDEAFNGNVAKEIANKTSSSFELQRNGRTFIVTVTFLDKGFHIIVLSDITAVKQGESMRSEFFANASHELKTPLTAIKGFNDIIALSTEEEKTRELSSKISKETDRIIALINDMLNISKLEAQVETHVENVSLAEIAEEVKESLSSQCESKNVSVEISGDATALMEKEHAIELVKNLVENAVRYNNDGGHVWVRIESVENKPRLTVEDDGIGIEEEHIGRLCERFYRVNKSRSRETGSTGLGLSIVKHICTLYHAKLDIESKFGVGTKVTVSF